MINIVGEGFGPMNPTWLSDDRKVDHLILSTVIVLDLI